MHPHHLVQSIAVYFLVTAAVIYVARDITAQFALRNNLSEGQEPSCSACSSCHPNSGLVEISHRQRARKSHTTEKP